MLPVQHHHHHIGVWASIATAGTIQVGDPVVLVTSRVFARGVWGDARPTQRRSARAVPTNGALSR